MAELQDYNSGIVPIDPERIPPYLSEMVQRLDEFLRNQKEHTGSRDTVFLERSASDNRDVLTILQPAGGTYSSTTATDTGAIKISLPVLWTNSMVKFEVDVFSFVSGSSFKVIVSGYNYSVSSAWLNCTAHIVGGTEVSVDHSVRFGHDGTNACVWIGETTDVWSYPKIAVRDVMVGHEGQTELNWLTGWNVDVIASLDTVQITKTKTQIGKWVDGV